MKVTQECDVRINVFCDEETEKPILLAWLKDYFNTLKDHKQLEIFKEPIYNLDVIDEEKGLIVIDLTALINCTFCPGWAGSRYEPPEYPSIDGCFTKEDFTDWILGIIPERFDYDIEIDDDSYIPTEEDLLEEMEARYEEY